MKVCQLKLYIRLPSSFSSSKLRSLLISLAAPLDQRQIMARFEVLVVSLLTLYFAAAITLPAGPHMGRRPVQPVRHVRLHRSGGMPVLRVRNVPVKRIYVPMKVIPQPQRYTHPPGAYKLGPPQPVWKPKAQLQAYRPVPQSFGPPRKARHPKPKYSQKPTYSYSPKLTSVPYDSYKPQPSFTNAAIVTDSYGAPKPNYKVPLTTYGKPHPHGSPEPPMKVDDTATSYINVYQGDKAKEDGKPTYSLSQTHGQNYEKKHKGTVYSDSEAIVSNHRPVYKHKSDSTPSQTTTEGSQGSFQPPKQTFGFQPYEDNRREVDSYSSQPSQQYYKKQPDTVLSPNYFEQGKS